MKREKIDLALLKKTLTKNEMSALWRRLTRRRASSDMTIRQMWDELCDMKVGQQAHKGEVLVAMALGENWRDRLITVTDTISKVEARQVTKTQYTKGELIQQHGRDEAEDFIRRGKYRAVEDADGDTVYIKEKRAIIETASREKTTQLSRQYDAPRF